MGKVLRQSGEGLFLWLTPSPANRPYNVVEWHFYGEGALSFFRPSPKSCQTFPNVVVRESFCDPSARPKYTPVPQVTVKGITTCGHFTQVSVRAPQGAEIPAGYGWGKWHNLRVGYIGVIISEEERGEGLRSEAADGGAARDLDDIDLSVGGGFVEAG